MELEIIRLDELLDMEFSGPSDVADLFPIPEKCKQDYRIKRSIRAAIAEAESRGMHPGRAQIAKETGLNVTTVARHLKAMDDVLPYLTYTKKYRLSPKGHRIYNSQKDDVMP